MREKYIELQNCLEKGNIAAMIFLAVLLSNVDRYLIFDINFIFKIIVIGFVLIFTFGGMLYGIKKIKFSFTLNPFALIINIYINCIKLVFFGFTFPFYYIITLIKYTIENKKKMCI